MKKILLLFASVFLINLDARFPGAVRMMAAGKRSSVFQRLYSMKAPGHLLIDQDSSYGLFQKISEKTEAEIKALLQGEDRKTVEKCLEHVLLNLYRLQVTGDARSEFMSRLKLEERVLKRHLEE